MARKPKNAGPVAVPPPESPEIPQPFPPQETPEPLDAEYEETQTEHHDPGERPVGRGHKRMGLSDLQARCSDIDNWEDWCLYLYRLSPFTDHTVAGKNVSITKYAEPIDETRVMHDYGSGGYRIIANRRRE